MQKYFRSSFVCDGDALLFLVYLPQWPMCTVQCFPQNIGLLLFKYDCSDILLQDYTFFGYFFVCLFGWLVFFFFFFFCFVFLNKHDSEDGFRTGCRNVSR